MSAPTHGPWTYQPTDDNFFEVSADGTDKYSQGIASIWYGPGGWLTERKKEEAEANARLIAESPALMNALATCVDVLDAIGRARHRSARMQTLLPYVKDSVIEGLAVLRKIRGES